MTTYYVRPADGGANGDGLGPGTSWNGFANIVWASVGGGGNVLTGQSLDFGATPLSIPVAANGVIGSKTVIQDITVDGAPGDCFDINPDLEYVRFIGCIALNAGNVGFELANGQVDSDFVGLDFIFCQGNGGGSGLRWVSNSASLSTMTGLLISGCTFNGNTFDGISLMMYSNTNPATAMTDIVIEGNSCLNNAPVSPGHGLRVRADTLVGTQRSGGNLQLYDNQITGNGNGDSNSGGCALGGFIGADVYLNNSSSNTGAIGGFDLFWLQGANVYDNTCNDNTGGTIDANGILLDHGNDQVRLYRNECSRNTLGTGENTGYAIMVLADNTNIDIWANYGDGNYRGLAFIGAGTPANVVAYNNTFTGCLNAAYRVSDGWGAANELDVRNNIFTGVGPVAVVESAPPAYTEDYNEYDGFTAEGRTLGANSTFGVDPDLNANGYTQTSSPGYNAGDFVTGFHDTELDQNGFTFKNPPDIGLQSNIIAPETAPILAEVGLTAVNIAQAQTLETPTVGEAAFVSPIDLFQGQVLETPDVTELGTIAIVDIAQAQSLDPAVLTQAQNTDVDSLTQAQTLGTLLVFQDTDLGAMDSLTQAQTLDVANVSEVADLVAEDITQSQTLGLAAMSQAQNLALEGIIQAQTLGRPTISDSTLPRLTPPTRRIKVAGGLRVISWGA